MILYWTVVIRGCRPGATDMKEYRIGEFAKYLGVTPDLLKHYEDQGIIRPSRSDSGYR